MAQAEDNMSMVSEENQPRELLDDQATSSDDDLAFPSPADSRPASAASNDSAIQHHTVPVDGASSGKNPSPQTDSTPSLQTLPRVDDLDDFTSIYAIRKDGLCLTIPSHVQSRMRGGSQPIRVLFKGVTKLMDHTKCHPPKDFPEESHIIDSDDSDDSISANDQVDGGLLVGYYVECDEAAAPCNTDWKRNQSISQHIQDGLLKAVQVAPDQIFPVVVKRPRQDGGSLSMIHYKMYEEVTNDGFFTGCRVGVKAGDVFLLSRYQDLSSTQKTQRVRIGTEKIKRDMRAWMGEMRLRNESSPITHAGPSTSRPEQPGPIGIQGSSLSHAVILKFISSIGLESLLPEMVQAVSDGANKLVLSDQTRSEFQLWQTMVVDTKQDTTREEVEDIWKSFVDTHPDLRIYYSDSARESGVGIDGIELDDIESMIYATKKASVEFEFHLICQYVRHFLAGMPGGKATESCVQQHAKTVSQIITQGESSSGAPIDNSNNNQAAFCLSRFEAFKNEIDTEKQHFLADLGDGLLASATAQELRHAFKVVTDQSSSDAASKALVHATVNWAFSAISKPLTEIIDELRGCDRGNKGGEQDTHGIDAFDESDSPQMHDELDELQQALLLQYEATAEELENDLKRSHDAIEEYRVGMERLRKDNEALRHALRKLGQGEQDCVQGEVMDEGNDSFDVMDVDPQRGHQSPQGDILDSPRPSSGGEHDVDMTGNTSPRLEAFAQIENTGHSGASAAGRQMSSVNTQADEKEIDKSSESQPLGIGPLPAASVSGENGVRDGMATLLRSSLPTEDDVEYERQQGDSQRGDSQQQPDTASSLQPTPASSTPPSSSQLPLGEPFFKCSGCQLYRPRESIENATSQVCRWCTQGQLGADLQTELKWCFDCSKGLPRTTFINDSDPDYYRLEEDLVCAPCFEHSMEMVDF